MKKIQVLLLLAVASDTGYITCRGSRRPILEKIAGDEIENLRVYEVLSRAETIFQAEFREPAEEKLANEARALREQGLNLNAIALKLNISRDRASGMLSGSKKGK
jgi:hypothetical protein